MYVWEELELAQNNSRAVLHVNGLSCLSSADLKNVWSYSSALLCRMVWYLLKYKDNRAIRSESDLSWDVANS
jgi:hypothetical protein